ncbi:MAG: cob(I)yrinic acid a,c-diamide adenosyltransferase, partial [Janthinobacterium sp.]
MSNNQPVDAENAANTAAINERHRVRMERKKAIIDAAIAKADKEIGI